MLGGAGPLQLVPLALPPVAVQVDARRRAEEALLVAVRLLGHLGVQDHHRLVAALAQVPLHRLPRKALLLRPEEREEG